MTTQVLQPTNEQQTVTLENVAFYARGSMFGVHRTDCRTLKISTGQKYAQYDNAIRIEYLEKGKRNARVCTLTYKPWLRVVSLAHAIAPDDPLVPTSAGCKVSRYASCDPRWASDFEDKLAADGVPVLLAIGEEEREACMRCQKRIATTEEGGSHVCGVCAAAIRNESASTVAEVTR